MTSANSQPKNARLGRRPARPDEGPLPANILLAAAAAFPQAAIARALRTSSAAVSVKLARARALSAAGIAEADDDIAQAWVAERAGVTIGAVRATLGAAGKGVRADGNAPIVRALRTIAAKRRAVYEVPLAPKDAERLAEWLARVSGEAAAARIDSLVNDVPAKALAAAMARRCASAGDRAVLAACGYDWLSGRVAGRALAMAFDIVIVVESRRWSHADPSAVARARAAAEFVRHVGDAACRGENPSNIAASLGATQERIAVALRARAMAVAIAGRFATRRRP
ncbi:MAG: hypothetical protein IBJ15_01055 [Alphaproteobacteria bacterium]|nr:hypothetical protein [Alphaproteobacteria bacterium]